MSLVVTRDQTSAGHIVFAWPDPVPWGAELICAEDEVVIICPNWEVGEELGPGRHMVSPPNPKSQILAYFISTTPCSVSFDQTVTAVDRSNGMPASIRFFGSAQVKVGDPTLLCHQVVGLPYRDFSTGILRSAVTSITNTFSQVISKVCLASSSMATLASAEAMTQLVNMAAGANPMAIAVTGLELVRFEEFSLSVNGNPPLSWRAQNPDSNSAQPMPRAGTGGEAPLPAGSPVLVYWNDGLWHTGTVRQYSDGNYQVSLDGVDTVSWVRANRIRSA